MFYKESYFTIHLILLQLFSELNIRFQAMQKDLGKNSSEIYFKDCVIHIFVQPK